LSPVPVRFPCKDITLEGELSSPEGEDLFPAVVISHPYPPRGGDMFSNVVASIFDALPRHRITAFRFNFRGVGNSGGSFDGGIGEQEDLKAALDFILSSSGIDNKRIGLAGYSFGGMISLRVAAQDERVSLLGLVSAALQNDALEQLAKYEKPSFLITGDADQMIPLERFQQYFNTANPDRFRVVPGADHFWGGYEDTIAREISRFFTTGFNIFKSE